jgi:hypothetical protein
MFDAWRFFVSRRGFFLTGYRGGRDCFFEDEDEDEYEEERFLPATLQQCKKSTHFFAARRRRFLFWDIIPDWFLMWRGGSVRLESGQGFLLER